MRAGMLHEHVVVQMLASSSDEEAVDQALATFACKNWMNIVTHNRSTQQDGVRCYVGMAGPLKWERGKDVGLRVFAHEQDVRDVGIFGGDQFGHRVRKRRAGLERGGIFDDTYLAAFF